MYMHIYEEQNLAIAIRNVLSNEFIAMMYSLSLSLSLEENELHLQTETISTEKIMLF